MTEFFVNNLCNTHAFVTTLDLFNAWVNIERSEFTYTKDEKLMQFG